MSGDNSKKVGRPTKYKPEMCDVVIASGADGKTLAEMADDLDIDRATLNDWANKNEEFSRAVKRGLEKAQAWWERQGRSATFGGVDGFNATSFIFQMKNRFRDEWNDKTTTELQGSVKIDSADVVAELSAFLDAKSDRSAC